MIDETTLALTVEQIRAFDREDSPARDAIDSRVRSERASKGRRWRVYDGLFGKERL
jgi:hypothetical protein